MGQGIICGYVLHSKECIMAYKTYKYKLQHQSNLYLLRQILDDLYDVSRHFYKLRKRHYGIYGKSDGYKRPTSIDFGKHFTKLKKRTKPHWNILPPISVQMELQRQEKALVRFFNNVSGYPKIKRKNSFKSFSLSIDINNREGICGSNWLIQNNRIRLGFRQWNENENRFTMRRVWYSFFKDRDWAGRIKEVTFKQDKCNDWWLCLTVEEDITEVKDTTGESVGIDFGLKNYLTLDDATRIESPEFFKQAMTKIRCLQKSLSRKVKGSGNWYRARLTLARCYRDITNRRSDWQWKLAEWLCNKYDTICIEDLNMAGMQRLWGKKISDLSHSSFVAILDFKCKKHNRELKRCDRWYPSSKTCNECGLVNDDLTLKDRTWQCDGCDVVLDRDVNAAINILRHA